MSTTEGPAGGGASAGEPTADPKRNRSHQPGGADGPYQTGERSASIDAAERASDAGASATETAAGAGMPAPSSSGRWPRTAAAGLPNSHDRDNDDGDSSLGSGARHFGPYELLHELGHGGMGVVYAARQVGLGRTVALKMIRAGEFASRDEVRRFQVEARNAAALDHPGIVPVYEVGEHRGRHYYTMKLVGGGSLAREAPSGFTGRPRAAAELIAAVARAVHHAHRRGVLHRDLKPSNILLDEQGRPQVADFGLARRLDAGTTRDRDDPGLTVAGAVLGSPNYMAPEQACGDRDLTVAVDVWALGAMMYELLTGRPPFRAATVPETLRLVREAAPRPPSALLPRVDRDLETVCLKCLEKQPGHRYRSAEALADDLDRVLTGRPPHARRPGWLAQAYGWCRRPERVGAAGATQLAISGVGGAFHLLYCAAALLEWAGGARLIHTPYDRGPFLGWNAAAAVMYLAWAVLGSRVAAGGRTAAWAGLVWAGQQTVFNAVAWAGLWGPDVGGVLIAGGARSIAFAMFGLISAAVTACNAVALVALYRGPLGSR